MSAGLLEAEGEEDVVSNQVHDARTRARRAHFYLAAFHERHKHTEVVADALNVLSAAEVAEVAFGLETAVEAIEKHLCPRFRLLPHAFVGAHGVEREMHDGRIEEIQPHLDVLGGWGEFKRIDDAPWGATWEQCLSGRFDEAAREALDG